MFAFLSMLANESHAYKLKPIEFPAHGNQDADKHGKADWRDMMHASLREQPVSNVVAIGRHLMVLRERQAQWSEVRLFLDLVRARHQ